MKSWEGCKEERGAGQDPLTAGLSPEVHPPSPGLCGKSAGVEVGTAWAPGEVLTISGSSSFALGVGGLYEGGPSRLLGRRKVKWSLRPKKPSYPRITADALPSARSLFLLPLPQKTPCPANSYSSHEFLFFQEASPILQED